MVAPAGTLWVDGWVWDALKRTSLEDPLVGVLAVVCASQKEEERGGGRAFSLWIREGIFQLPELQKVQK